MTARDAEGNPFQPVSPASETRHTFPAWEHRPASPARFERVDEGSRWRLTQEHDFGMSGYTAEVWLDDRDWRDLAHFILANLEDE